MQQRNFPIPITPTRINDVMFDCVDLGPLLVNFGTRQQAWVVTHRTSGCFVGEPWETCQEAIAAAGALLSLPTVNWESNRPVMGYTETEVLGALERVRKAVGR